MIVEITENNYGKTAICKCDWCGKEFSRCYSNIKKSKHFCSVGCKTKWQSVTNLGEGNSFFGKRHKRKNKERQSKYMINRMQGSDNPSWNGGRHGDGQGYILIHKPEHPLAGTQNYVREHRIVMEKYLGRYLTKEEIVHHINGIRNDNRIENLMLFESNSAHRSYHKKQKVTV